MLNLLRSVVLAGLSFFKTRRQLAFEVLALRHQLGVLKRSVKRPRLTHADRGLWVLLSRRWANWRDALIIVQPDTVIRWYRAGFRKYWAWRSRPKGGRPAIDRQIRALIRRMATANMWGAPRIIGTLRREVLDHVVVLGEQQLRRLLRCYLDDYYHPCRTHLSLGKDSPAGREVEQAEMGNVIELPIVGGLHHRYTRRAA